MNSNDFCVVCNVIVTNSRDRYYVTPGGSTLVSTLFTKLPIHLRKLLPALDWSVRNYCCRMCKRLLEKRQKEFSSLQETEKNIQKVINEQYADGRPREDTTGASDVQHSTPSKRLCPASSSGGHNDHDDFLSSLPPIQPAPPPFRASSSKVKDASEGASTVKVQYEYVNIIYSVACWI